MALKNYKEILQKEAQRVDIKDRKIFERGSLPSFFGRGVTDTIEFILYDNGDNQLPQGESGKLVRYVNIADVENIRKYILIARGKTSNATTEYFVDIERLINEAGYKNGLFRTQISLLNKRVGSEANQNKVWITGHHLGNSYHAYNSMESALQNSNTLLSNIEPKINIRNKEPFRLSTWKIG